MHYFVAIHIFALHNKLAMNRKPQQQTLSIRISDEIRDFLERSKDVISSARGESVSISDVAKFLLESAKDDRLDSRLEAAELQNESAESLWNIRRKWEQKHDLSRAEWIFMSQYVQVACEEITENPGMPLPESYAVLLEALLDIRALRLEHGVGLDRYYLENIGIDDKKDPQRPATRPGDRAPGNREVDPRVADIKGAR